MTARATHSEWRKSKWRCSYAIVVAALLCTDYSAIAAVAAGSGDTTRVRGVVIAPSGHPSVGAHVGIVLSNEIRSVRGISVSTMRTRTDDFGRFTLVVPRELRAVTFAIHAAGSASQYSSLVILNAPRKELPEVRLERGLQVAGRVIDAEVRAPVHNLSVDVIDPAAPEDSTPMGTGARKSVTRADGSFLITGLRAASHTLVFKRDGFATRTLYKVRAPATNLLVEVSKGAYLLGQVVGPSGAPIPNAELVARPGQGEVIRGGTDGSGRFRLGPFARGAAMELVVSASGFAPARNDDIAAPNANVLIALEANGILRGRVLEEGTNRPVTAFRISFHRRASAPLRTSAYPGERQFANEDGRFEWSDVQAGVWTISVESRGYQRLEVAGLSIKGGAPTNELQLYMRQGQSVHGRVFDRGSGEVVSSALINYETQRLVAHETLTLPQRAATRVNSNGQFTLDDLPAGRIVISVHAEGYADVVREVVAGEESYVEIGLLPGAKIKGRLVEADGMTGTKGAVTLFEISSESYRTVGTDADGQFELADISDGRFVLTGSTLQGRTKDVELNVKAGRPHEIVLPLIRGHRIEGTIYGLMPGERGRSRVAISGAGGFDKVVSVSNDDTYVVDNVPAGRVEATVTTSLLRKISRTVEASQQTVTLDLVFPRENFQVTGRITRGGKPVRFLGVTAEPLEGQSVAGYGETSQSGQYTILGLSGGAYALQPKAGPRRPTRVVLAENVTVNFDLPDISVAGLVSDAESALPISGVTVELSPADPEGRSFLGTTNAAGAFLLSGVLSGDYWILAHKSGYDIDRRVISVSDSVSNLDLRVRQGAVVPVRVRDGKTQTPLKQVAVWERSGAGYSARIDMRLDTAGVGEIPRSLAGRDIIVSHVGYQDAVVKSWNGESLEVSLVPAERLH